MKVNTWKQAKWRVILDVQLMALNFQPILQVQRALQWWAFIFMITLFQRWSLTYFGDIEFKVYIIAKCLPDECARNSGSFFSSCNSWHDLMIKCPFFFFVLLLLPFNPSPLMVAIICLVKANTDYIVWLVLSSETGNHNKKKIVHFSRIPKMWGLAEH